MLSPSATAASIHSVSYVMPSLFRSVVTPEPWFHVNHVPRQKISKHVDAQHTHIHTLLSLQIYDLIMQEAINLSPQVSYIMFLGKIGYIIDFNY